MIGWDPNSSEVSRPSLSQQDSTVHNTPVSFSGSCRAQLRCVCRRAGWVLGFKVKVLSESSRGVVAERSKSERVNEFSNSDTCQSRHPRIKSKFVTVNDPGLGARGQLTFSPSYIVHACAFLFSSRARPINFASTLWIKHCNVAHEVTEFLTDRPTNE